MNGVYVLWLSVQWNRLLFCTQDHHQGGSDLNSISESLWHDLHSLVISERGLRAMAVTPNCNFGARKKEARATLRLRREKNLYSSLLSRPWQPVWKSRKCCWNNRIYEPRRGCHDLKLSGGGPDSNHRIIKASQRIKSGDLPWYRLFQEDGWKSGKRMHFFFLRWDFLDRLFFFYFPTNYVIFLSASTETLHHVVCPHIIPSLLL